MNECPVCEIPLGYYEACPSPGCPCFGHRSNSDAAIHAARNYYSKASQRSNLVGEAGIDILLRDLELHYSHRAYGDDDDE